MKPRKLQKLGGDLLYDLRSRGLLPIVALLLIAIVAAPLLISKLGAEDTGPAAGAAAAGVTKPPPEAQAAVVSYQPGVRDYRKRLEDLAAKDPFKQQYTDSGKKSGNAAGGDTGATTAGGGSTGGGSGGTTKTVKKSWRTTLSYQVDVRSGESGGELKRENGIKPYKVLPSDDTPVGVFLGVDADSDQAVFSVSRQVTGVGGDGVCYPAPDNCQLLGLLQGEGADLNYSVDNKTYRIEVARIKLEKKVKELD